jgi:hypothetical protein
MAQCVGGSVAAKNHGTKRPEGQQREVTKTMVKSLAGSSVFALALLLMTATASFALPSDGFSEILLSGGFFHAQGSDDGNFNADLSYGYYLSRVGKSGCAKA